MALTTRSNHVEHQFNPHLGSQVATGLYRLSTDLRNALTMHAPYSYRAATEILRMYRFARQISLGRATSGNPDGREY